MTARRLASTSPQLPAGRALAAMSCSLQISGKQEEFGFVTDPEELASVRAKMLRMLEVKGMSGKRGIAHLDQLARFLRVPKFNDEQTVKQLKNLYTELSADLSSIQYDKYEDYE